jgi:hypothetical protein
MEGAASEMSVLAEECLAENVLSRHDNKSWSLVPHGTKTCARRPPFGPRLMGSAWSILAKEAGMSHDGRYVALDGQWSR